MLEELIENSFSENWLLILEKVYIDVVIELGLAESSS